MGQSKKQARGGSQPLRFPHGQMNQLPYQDSVEVGTARTTRRGTTQSRIVQPRSVGGTSGGLS